MCLGVWGGNNGENNLTKLTPREHFVAHLLLVRMTNGVDKRKMAYAVICFKRPNPNHKREIKNSRSFENVKKLLSSLPVSKETGQKISSALKGKKRSPEVCAAISKANKGKIVSDEARRKMSAAKIGTTASQATREKMSNAKKGKPFSETHCNNISKAYTKSAIRTAAISKSNLNKRKPCTVDGITIYESKKDLEKALGRGKLGSRSPNFKFVE